MTTGTTAAAQAVAAPGTQVVGCQPGCGPVSIESRCHEVFAAAGLAEQVCRAVAQSFDAAVSACGGMAVPCAKRQQRLGVTVVDGVTA